MNERPPQGKLSLGAALGQIIASYRDGDTKSCAEALVEIVSKIEMLENQLPTDEMVLVKRSDIEWLARQKLENDLGHDAYVAMEAVSMAQRVVKEAQAK